MVPFPVPDQVMAYLIETGISAIRLFAYLASEEAYLVEMVAKPVEPDDVTAQLRLRQRAALKDGAFFSSGRTHRMEQVLATGRRDPGDRSIY